jgi:hypothetical protein
VRQIEKIALRKMKDFLEARGITSPL